MSWLQVLMAFLFLGARCVYVRARYPRPFAVGCMMTKPGLLVHTRSKPSASVIRDSVENEDNILLQN